MALEMSKTELKEIVERFSYAKNGDNNERQYAHGINEEFPNSEKFWKLFIVPLTKRIESTGDGEAIRVRPEVSDELQELASYHYSIFLNLIYAKDCLLKRQLGYFENFYTHLSSVFDLTEEFLNQAYSLANLSSGIIHTPIPKHDKSKFLELAGLFYDKEYDKAYEHYFRIGKVTPLRIIKAENSLIKYFNDSKEWKRYSSFSIRLKGFRNKVVHNIQQASRIIDDKVLVPKTNFISDYKSWKDVFNASSVDVEKKFIEKDTQMKENLKELLEILNDLWKKPITDFSSLLYSGDNKTLSDFYGISIQNEPTGYALKLSNMNNGISGSLPVSEAPLSASTGQYGSSGFPKIN
jgi:hypothetical protein